MDQMKIEPKIMKNVCINAHPIGMQMFVQSQVDYVKKQNTRESDASTPKNVLVIGSSAGYGLASRIVAAFGYAAKTVGVAFEMPANPEKKRTASAGWYATKAFEAAAAQEGIWTKSIFGDAFSDDIKAETIDCIKKEMGSVDLVVYSLAAPKRIDPRTGTTHISVLKPIGQEFGGTSINVVDAALYDVTVPPANEQEIADTVKVMGGEDWEWWIDALMQADALSENALTLAYSYIGPQITSVLYRSGTIGKAKEDLEQRAHAIDQRMQNSDIGGRAYVSVNKALVTRASSVIPVVPLYLSILYKVMKEENCHETCIEQMQRLFSQRLYGGVGVHTDEAQRIRMDDWEMRPNIQERVLEIWDKIDQKTLTELSDVEGYRKEFYHIHGFMWDNVDYSREVVI